MFKVTCTRRIIAVLYSDPQIQTGTILNSVLQCFNFLSPELFGA